LPSVSTSSEEGVVKVHGNFPLTRPGLIVVVIPLLILGASVHFRY